MPRKPPKGKSLAEVNPELANQWHPTKNGNLTPLDVLAGSHKKVWWKCDKGDDHEWISLVFHRARGRGCSICAGKKIVKSNCLANLNPDLAKQWHPTKNGDLTPKNVSNNSNKKVWWKCDKGDDHEWQTSISNRNSGRDCPYCSNRKVILSNCLATTHPELAKQWHPTKNGNLTAYDVTYGSENKIWWQCNNDVDHIWETSINKRASGRDCPMCAKYGFNRNKDALFYIRRINLDNGKNALKFGITNNMDGHREKQQIRHVLGNVKTIFKVQFSGEKALDVERLCKRFFGSKGYLSENEFPDGFTETIKYSEDSLDKIKSLVKKVLNS